MKNLSNLINNCKITDNSEDQIPSPTNDFISSFLDNSEISSPLEELLKCQLGLNVLMLIEIFILIISLINILYINKSFNILNKLDKYLNITNKFSYFINKTKNFNHNFFIVIIIIISISLIFNIFISIYISSELSINLQDYVDVHNYIKKGLLLASPPWGLRAPRLFGGAISLNLRSQAQYFYQTRKLSTHKKSEKQSGKNKLKIILTKIRMQILNKIKISLVV
jgi:hypothetical protein